MISMFKYCYFEHTLPNNTRLFKILFIIFNIVFNTLKFRQFNYSIIKILFQLMQDYAARYR